MRRPSVAAMSSEQLMPNESGCIPAADQLSWQDLLTLPQLPSLELQAAVLADSSDDMDEPIIAPLTQQQEQHQPLSDEQLVVLLQQALLAQSLTTAPPVVPEPPPLPAGPRGPGRPVLRRRRARIVEPGSLSLVPYGASEALVWTKRIIVFQSALR